MKPKTRSKFETRIYKYLKKKRVNFKYESRKIPYVLACHYNPDWDIETPNGWILVETKGYFKAADKRKLIAVKKQHPELDLRILFYRYNKDYERWCIKNGFRFAFAEIPDEWLEGL